MKKVNTKLGKVDYKVKENKITVSLDGEDFMTIELENYKPTKKEIEKLIEEAIDEILNS